MILKEDMLFRINVQLRQITELQGHFKSLVELRLYTANRLSYELGLHGDKSQWKTGILLKMDTCNSEDYIFDTSKPGSFNS